MSHYIIVKETVTDEEENEFFDEIESELALAGFDVTIYSQLDRTIIHAVAGQDIDGIKASLTEQGLTVEDSWTSCGPSGHKLDLTLFYHDEKQVVSASIDEGELLEALKGIENDDLRERRKLYAVTAFAYDNEFSEGYGFFEDSMEIQLLDIMHEVKLWFDHEELKHYVSPAENPPMAEFTFWPCAQLPTGDIVDIVLPGVETTFAVAAQNLRGTIDVADEADRKHILAQRGVPEKLKDLAEILTFRLSLNNPEVMLRHAGEEPTF